MTKDRLAPTKYNRLRSLIGLNCYDWQVWDGQMRYCHIVHPWPSVGGIIGRVISLPYRAIKTTYNKIRYGAVGTILKTNADDFVRWFKYGF